LYLPTGTGPSPHPLYSGRMNRQGSRPSSDQINRPWEKIYENRKLNSMSLALAGGGHSSKFDSHDEQYDQSTMFEGAKSGLFEIMRFIDDRYGHLRKSGTITIRIALERIDDAYKVFTEADDAGTPTPRTSFTHIHNAYNVLTAADKFLAGSTCDPWSNALETSIRETRSDYERIEKATWTQIESAQAIKIGRLQTQLHYSDSRHTQAIRRKDEEIASLRAKGSSYVDECFAKDTEIAHLHQSLKDMKSTVEIKNDIIESLDSVVDDERSKYDGLEEIILRKDAEINNLQVKLQSSDRHLPKADYKKLNTTERAKLKLDRSCLPPPPVSPQQLDEAQTFFKSFLSPAIDTKDTHIAQFPPVDTDSVAHCSDVSLAESSPSTPEIYQIEANDVVVQESPIKQLSEPTVPTNDSEQEENSTTTSAPAIRFRSQAPSTCSIRSDSPSSSIKSSSTIKSISPIPSLKSPLRIGNLTSKPSIVLDDTASITTIDVSDNLPPVMSSLRTSTGTSIVLTDDLAPDPLVLDDSASISAINVSGDLPPDPKIFVMSSLRSSAGTSVVLTDDLAPDPFIVPSTQPPATTVVLSDELAPD